MAKITSKVKSVAKTVASPVKKNAAAAASAPKPAAATKTIPGPSKSSGGSSKGSSGSNNKLPITGGTRESLNPVGPTAPSKPQFAHSTAASATDDLAMRKGKAATFRGSAGGTASRSIGVRGPSKTFKSSVKTPGRMK